MKIKKSEKYLVVFNSVPYRWARRCRTHRKNPCDVLSVQPLFTSSVVVTFVQVMQRDTSCPANKEKTNRLVQTLFQRAAKLAKKAPGDDQVIGGRLGGEAASLRDSIFSSMLVTFGFEEGSTVVAISPAGGEVMVGVERQGSSPKVGRASIQ